MVLVVLMVVVVVDDTRKILVEEKGMNRTGTLHIPHYSS